MLQKELEKEIRKVTDKQTELSADIQSVRKDMSFEFDKHNSSEIVFRKQLQVNQILCFKIITYYASILKMTSFYAIYNII